MSSSSSSARFHDPGTGASSTFVNSHDSLSLSNSSSSMSSDGPFTVWACRRGLPFFSTARSISSESMFVSKASSQESLPSTLGTSPYNAVIPPVCTSSFASISLMLPRNTAKSSRSMVSRSGVFESLLPPSMLDSSSAAGSVVSSVATDRCTATSAGFVIARGSELKKTSPWAPPRMPLLPKNSSGWSGSAPGGTGLSATSRRRSMFASSHDSVSVITSNSSLWGATAISSSSAAMSSSSVGLRWGLSRLAPRTKAFGAGPLPWRSIDVAKSVPSGSDIISKRLAGVKVGRCIGATSPRFSTLWRAGSYTGGPAPSLSTRPVVGRKKDIVKGSHPLASGAAAGAAAPKVLTGPDVICSGSVVPGISAGASWTGIDTMRSRGSKVSKVVSIISNGASWIGMDKRSSTSASISLISSSSKLRAALLCARFDVMLKATAALAHDNSIRAEAARKEADGGMTCVAK